MTTERKYIPGTVEEYRGFKIVHSRTSWYVYAQDGELISSPLESRERAQQVVERFVRMGGKA